jgi:hypothetical protein
MKLLFILSLTLIAVAAQASSVYCNSNVGRGSPNPPIYVNAEIASGALKNVFVHGGVNASIASMEANSNPRDTKWIYFAGLEADGCSHALQFPSGFVQVERFIGNFSTRCGGRNSTLFRIGCRISN